LQYIYCYLLPRLETVMFSAVMKPLNPFLKHLSSLSLQYLIKSLIYNLPLVKSVEQYSEVILVITDLYDYSTLYFKQSRLSF